jgi:protein involved in polysaccharide export with SLBB domain
MRSGVAVGAGRLLFGVLASVVVPVFVAGAQSSLGLTEIAIRKGATRAELTAIADSLERVLGQMASTDRRRPLVQSDLSEQRRRLVEGDLRANDRLLVKFQAEVQQVDTVTVSPTLGVAIARLAEIPIRGVLFSELDTHLQSQVDRYVRNAKVTVVPLVSVGVFGSVTRPGYYLLPQTATLAEALMTAGGPVADADAGGVMLKHGGSDRWTVNQMTAALQSQLSIAALGAENGDVLEIGRRTAPYDRTFVFTAAGLVLQLLLTLTIIRGA